LPFSSENIFFKLFRYIILAMSRQNRVRKLINLDIKKEIISKRESGKSVGDLSAEYGMAKSTISKSKSKAVPLHAMEALGGRGGIAPTYSRPRH
jgi:hypothetical protein